MCHFLSLSLILLYVCENSMISAVEIASKLKCNTCSQPESPRAFNIRRVVHSHSISDIVIKKYILNAYCLSVLALHTGNTKMNIT